MYNLNQNYGFLEVLSDQMPLVTENNTNQVTQQISTIKNTILPPNSSMKFSNLLENNQSDNRVEYIGSESKYKNILTVIKSYFLN